MPSHRPTPEQYAAMISAATAAGQPLPRHHVSLSHIPAQIERHFHMIFFHGISQMNGKPKIAQMTRTGSGRKQVISWMDAPDDVYFRATDGSK